MFTEEMDKILTEGYKDRNKSFSQIQAELGVTKGQMQTRVKELGLVKERVDAIFYTEEIDDKIREGYASNLVTVWDIAKDLGISEKSVQRRAKQLGLRKVKFIPSLADGTKERILKVSQEEDLTWEEMSDKLGLDPETIRGHLISMGVKKKPSNRTSRKVPDTPEFYEDLGNPRLSASDIATKYKVSDGCILQWRRKVYGEFKNQLHTTARLTSADTKVKEVLDELDLAYFFNKGIGKWKVDFYLGQKGIIEVHGDYWHNLEETIKKDQRKARELAKKGYKMLFIWESELSNMKQVKERIQRFWVSLISDNK